MSYDFNTDFLYSNHVTCGALALPEVDAASGALVVTDGAGVLSLAVKAYVEGPASAVDESVAVYDGVTGKLIKSTGASVTVAGVATVTGLNVGALAYPAVDSTAGYLVQTDGAGTLSFVDPMSVAGVHDAAAAEQTTVYTADLAAGNHVKFTSLMFNVGSAVTMDTSTTYTTTANVDSLGRATLVAGNKYWLDFSIPRLKVKNHMSTFTIAWYNADANTQIGNSLVWIGDGASNPEMGMAQCKAYFAPVANTRVEMRIVTNDVANGLLSVSRVYVKIDKL